MKGWEEGKGSKEGVKNGLRGKKQVENGKNGGQKRNKSTQSNPELMMVEPKSQGGRQMVRARGIRHENGRVE